MTTTPDSIGSDQLKELLDAAPTDNSPADGPYDGLTKDELQVLIKKTLDTFDERCNHPVAQKLMALIIISNGIGWHTKAGNHEFKQDDPKSATCWLRDAGKLQAAAQTLESVAYGPDDFTYGE